MKKIILGTFLCICFAAVSVAQVDTVDLLSPEKDYFTELKKDAAARYSGFDLTVRNYPITSALKPFERPAAFVLHFEDEGYLHFAPFPFGSLYLNGNKEGNALFGLFPTEKDVKYQKIVFLTVRIKGAMLEWIFDLPIEDSSQKVVYEKIIFVSDSYPQKVSRELLLKAEKNRHGIIGMVVSFATSENGEVVKNP